MIAMRMTSGDTTKAKDEGQSTKDEVGGFSLASLDRGRSKEVSRYRWSEEVASAEGSGQDRCVVIGRDDLLVVAVADGAGGISGGTKAAASVIDQVRLAVAQGKSLVDALFWSGFLADIDLELAQRQVGETTAVVAVL